MKDHCWHSTGFSSASIPPRHPEVCCWCGQQRVRTFTKAKKQPKHGKLVYVMPIYVEVYEYPDEMRECIEHE